MTVIRQVLTFIEENIGKGLSVDSIVKFSGYSRRAVHDLFIKTIGVSPGGYIRGRKLCKAALWLRLTSMSGVQIAVELEFSSQQSFSREFKRYFGVGPREYRNSDTWDMSLLVPPMRLGSHKRLIQSCSHLVTLPDMYLSGFEVSVNGYLPCEGMRRGAERCGAEWQKMILENLNRSKQDLFFASTVSVLPGGVEWFKVNTFIGMIDVTTVKNKMCFIPSGLYIKYIFSGTLKKYATLPNDIALDLLPTQGLKRRKGADIEYFKYSGDCMKNTGVVSCEYYMPVSY